MCYPKPRARCVSNINKQYTTLLNKEQKTKEHINFLLSQDPQSTKIVELRKELNQIQIEIEKNRIDWNASSEGQKVFQSLENKNLMTDTDLLEQRIAAKRKMFQDTVYKKITMTEQAYPTLSEGLWACKHTSGLIISSLTYDLNAAQSREIAYKTKLSNSMLPELSRKKVQVQREENSKTILVIEMNIADMESFSKENEQKYLDSFNPLAQPQIISHY